MKGENNRLSYMDIEHQHLHLDCSHGCLSRRLCSVGELTPSHYS
jgi:hypothetical protein